MLTFFSYVSSIQFYELVYLSSAIFFKKESTDINVLNFTVTFPNLKMFFCRYWPVIDDALRKAAFDRQVHVRLLASLWNHTRPDLKFYLRSLAALNTANHASVQVVCTT